MERVKVNLSAIRDRKWAARMKKLGCTPEQIDLDPGTLLCSPPATLNSFH
jgi:hypothetical protein